MINEMIMNIVEPAILSWNLECDSDSLHAVLPYAKFDGLISHSLQKEVEVHTN